MFYKAVVQSVLLYGCETWVVTPDILRHLRGFHHRVARRLSGMTARRDSTGRWVYPPISEALSAAGLYSIEHYIGVRQATLVQTIALRPITALCQVAERRPGSSRRTYWWEQERMRQLL